MPAPLLALTALSASLRAWLDDDRGIAGFRWSSTPLGALARQVRLGSTLAEVRRRWLFAPVQTADFEVDGDAYGVWPVDASAGTVTVTLPLPELALGRPYQVQRRNAAGGAVVVVAAGGANVQGGPDVTLTAAGTSLSLVSDGTAYWIV